MKKSLFIISILLLSYSKASLLFNLETGLNEYRLNNYDFAKNYFISYINNNPNDKDGYFWYAKTLEKLDIKKYSPLIFENYKKAYELTLNDKNIEKITFSSAKNQNIEDYFDMSIMYFEQGNLKTSEQYADLMLKINPKSPSAYFIKAKIALVKNNKEKAKEYINQAIIFNNKYIETNLAKALEINEIPEITQQMYNIYALEAYFSGNIETAIKYLEKSKEKNPQDIDTNSLLLELYINNNDLDKAQKLSEELLKQNSKNINIKLLCAKLYKLTKQNDKIENTLLDAYKINPNNKYTLLMLGNYYLEKKDYISSKQYFEQLTNINDEMYEAYFGYIYSLIQLNDIEKALPLTRKAITLNPKNSEMQYLLALICTSQAQYDEAANYIIEAIKNDENPQYYIKLAKLNYILKKYPQSIINLKDALSLNQFSQDKEAIDEYMLKNYIKLEDEKNTANYLKGKLKLDKNRIIYKYILYKLYKLQGNEKQASSQLKELKKIKPKTLIDYLDLSEVQFEEKGIEFGIKTLNNGIKKYPDTKKLYEKKLEFYFIDQNQEEIKKTIEEMNKAFKQIAQKGNIQK